MPEYQPKTYKPSSPEEIISKLTPEEREAVVNYHISTHGECNPGKALEVCLPKGGHILVNALVGASRFRKVPDPQKLRRLRDDLRGITSEELQKYQEHLREEQQRG